MYEGACKLMAKQKVALDCLSYHAAANDDDTNKLATADIPKAVEFKLDRSDVNLNKFNLLSENFIRLLLCDHKLLIY